MYSAQLYEPFNSDKHVGHGSPHEHPHAVDAHEQFIEMPDAIGTPALAVNVGVDCRTEFVGLTANRLGTEVYCTLGQQIFVATQARSETEIEPSRQADGVRRQALTLVGNGFHCRLSMRRMAARGIKLPFA
ncbi:hypothetical protein [Sphingosinicella microcystinivorans]|uniref:hypothetical protein n=1 Tax=Sphingosinicella microcystinivorans TaxID=335406 RepID=UPI000F829002|nr:hypothetical protein [Sphingosinicella microcystinivorans]